MKKRLLTTTLALAMALIIASPATSITSHAQGFNADAPEDTTGGSGKMPSNNWDWFDSGSSDSGSSSSASASSYDSGSSDNGSSDSGSSSSGTVSSSSSSTVKNKNDVTVSVTGGQKFRIVMDAKHTSYQVYHCGISRVSLAVTDAKGNAVAFSNVKLEKGEDKLWYLNITFAEGVDTKDFTVNVTKGDASYLSTNLGVSGIKINGTAALSTVPTTDAK